MLTQQNAAIIFVLASPSILPFWGIKSMGPTLGKMCKRDDSGGRVFPWLSWVLPGEH